MASLFKHKRTTLERAEKYISTIEWTDCNLTSRLYPNRQPVTELTCYSPPFAPVTLHPELKRVEFEDVVKEQFETVKLGQDFGPTWATHWFRLEINIPEAWIGKEVHLCWDCGCESLIWSEDGQPLAGLSSDDSQVEKVDYILTKKLVHPIFKQVFYVEIACNEMFGASTTGLVGPPDPNRYFTLKMADIAVFDRQINGLIQDLKCLTGIAKYLPEDNQRGYQALYAANQIVNAIQLDMNFEEAAKVANNFFSVKNGLSQHTIIAFEWVKKYYPTLFDRIRRFVIKSQFVCVGGTWVEMDGNIPSGESLLRQFLYGQKFFQDNFGLRCTEFWLPDTFGYSAQLPQIAKHCGIERFLTQKMSWNLVNSFPHQNFLWEGIDGTVIITHFPPGESYTMSMEVEEVIKTVTNLKEKGRVNHSMFLYGHGDGGGGPTEDMLERAQRLHDVDGIPKVQLDKPSKFFTELEHCTANLCRWVGELYLELHNGTYTTQGNIKKSNRRGEFGFHDVEFLASLLFSHTRQEIDYPSEQMEEMWHTLLLNQFHDVLPGSIIRAAVDEANKMYASLLEKQLEMRTNLLDKLFGPSGGNEELQNSIIINTLSWPRTESLNLANNNTVIVSASAMGASKFQPISDYPPVSLERMGTLFVFKNSFIQATVNHCGHVVSLKLPASQNDFIALGHPANQLVLFDDIPLFWDAWDVMDYHLETRRVQNKISTPMKILIVSPMRVVLQCKLSIGVQSELCLKIIMDACKPYLLFDITVDWRENHKFLKVEFPANVLAHEATYEIQYGHLTRPTHRNTSWDTARFEVCGHKWADISEHDFGLSILNDSKYGYSALGNVLSLSLLRSSKRPDETADMGTHSFRYAVMPHFGTFQSAGVIERAYELNCPLILHHSDLTRNPVVDLTTSQSWFWVDTNGVIIDTVKKAERTSQEIIIRIYEAYGRKVQAKISSTLTVRSVVPCSGLEDVLSEPMLWLDGGVIVELSPFQIMSLKL
uniref:alpha-mannosidase n=1 Tax=Strigamia maritima TaxID=126957 RepID=T1IQW1_STRMM